MTRYETFKQIPAKRKDAIRSKIIALFQQGCDTMTIAKRTSLGHRSVATAIGNITRKTCKRSR